MDFLLGVLGGMGPEAAVEFLRRLIRLTPADSDQQHIPVLLLNDPRIPDRTAAIKREGPSPVHELIDAAGKLEAAGCDLIVIPCNTAHVWFREISAAVETPFLNIIKATVGEAVSLVPDPVVGLLATDGTLSSGLYQDALEEKGVDFLQPDEADQRSVMEIVFDIKREGATKAAQERLESVMSRLVERGANVLVAGCTELPLVLPDRPPVPAADSLSAPAAAVVALLRRKGLLS